MHVHCARGTWHRGSFFFSILSVIGVYESILLSIFSGRFRLNAMPMHRSFVGFQFRRKKNPIPNANREQRAE